VLTPTWSRAGRKERLSGSTSEMVVVANRLPVDRVVDTDGTVLGAVSRGSVLSALAAGKEVAQ
jgi:hypothetical protein